ncbi:M4 family metallopeptidase [Streptomyces sanyensis]|uniref:Neutral metalloproteinase n=2 Tax=Streptomyces sanyensis TaxID=568869 RepID=A0ABP8ZY61_9ACTN
MAGRHHPDTLCDIARMDHALPAPCGIVPPHLLERLARSGGAAPAEAARRTLETDARLRTARRLDPAHRARAAGDAGDGGDGGDGGTARRTLYDAGNRTLLPGVRVRSEGGEPVADACVNRVHAGLGATAALLHEVYGRRSLDGAGLPLEASVHYGEGYANASWDGRRLVLGDGDGEVFGDFTAAVDVIAHELAHGLTQHSAGLAHFGQPGALNESVSDVVGSLVKQRVLGQGAEEADWLVGAGLLGPRVPGAALRSLRAPGTAYDDALLGADPQPATMAGYVRTPRDNGGVHINSGIPNHAFYLLATRLGGPAWERAGRIWLDVLTGGRLHRDADFAAFARLTAAAAAERYGRGEEHDAVLKAWSQVGVDPGAR